MSGRARGVAAVMLLVATATMAGAADASPWDRAFDSATGVRVYDSRYPRYCPGGVKFPLGYWKQGEVRDYRLTCDGGRSTRTHRVTIEAIDFTHASAAHSLRFHWRMDEGRGRGTDMHYTYSPRLGMVQVQGNE